MSALAGAEARRQWRRAREGARDQSERRASPRQDRGASHTSSELFVCSWEAHQAIRGSFGGGRLEVGLQAWRAFCPRRKPAPHTPRRRVFGAAERSEKIGERARRAGLAARRSRRRRRPRRHCPPPMPPATAAHSHPRLPPTARLPQVFGLVGLLPLARCRSPEPAPQAVKAPRRLAAAHRLAPPRRPTAHTRSCAATWASISAKLVCIISISGNQGGKAAAARLWLEHPEHRLRTLPRTLPKHPEHCLNTQNTA